jgi:hypothetical protein
MWMWTWWLRKMVENLPSFGHRKVTILKPFLNNLTLGPTNNLHPSSWLCFEWDPLKDRSNIIISKHMHRVWGLYYEIQLHRCSRAWPMPNSVPRFHRWMTRGVGPRLSVPNKPNCCIVLSQTCRKEQSFLCSKWLSARNLQNCCIAPSHTCWKEQSFLCSKRLSARKLCNFCIVSSHTHAEKKNQSFVPRGFQPATCEIVVLYPPTHAKKKNHSFVPRWLIDTRTIQVQSPTML